MFNWYAISTYSGREESVMMELKRRISVSSASRFFKDIRVPKYTETKKVKNGKTKTVEKVTLPGYILVNMDIKDKAAESLVRNTQGVIGFVGTGGKASPLSAHDMNNILGKTPALSKNKSEELYKVGDEIVFIDGPFLSMEGRVEDIMEDKLKISVEGLFERTIEVEVEIKMVRKRS